MTAGHLLARTWVKTVSLQYRERRASVQPMRRASFITAIWFFILLGPTLGRATEVQVVVDHYPPWKIVKGDAISGIDIELTKALLAEVDVTPRFVACPWSRCLDMLKSGDAQMVSGALKRADREQYLTFIDPPYKTKSSKVFYRLESSQDITSLQDLQNKDIGVLRDAHYFAEFDEDSSLSKKPVHSDRLNFLKLAQGRLHAVIATESHGDYLIAILGLRDIVVKSTYRHDAIVPVHFAVAKGSLMDRMRPQLNKAARRLRDNGTFEKIIKEYYQSLRKEQ